jgi:hypothetical protein
VAAARPGPLVRSRKSGPRERVLHLLYRKLRHVEDDSCGQ